LVEEIKEAIAKVGRDVSDAEYSNKGVMIVKDEM